jgi:formimidoylglutamate deiminase
MPKDSTQILFAPTAWVDGRMQCNVRLTVQDGNWKQIEINGSGEGAQLLGGWVLPGVVNAHSHAFQRAMAGCAEHRSMAASAELDDFWSWREQMYRVAQRITPDQLEAIATQLYTELLAGGYTHVCEFHYLHNDMDGKPYANAAELAMAIVRAAQNAGIGLTLLPTLYMHSGFGGKPLRSEQGRFACTPDDVLRLQEQIEALNLPQVNAGVALHSLRAVDVGALQEISQAANKKTCPVHIHISEQTQEVQDCVSHYGQRPIEWLLAHASVNEHWNLVHATHASQEELRSLAQTRANIVLCPSTEANLGDGVFDLPTWLQIQGNWSVGSDSHIARRWVDEFSLLEYSQRLLLKQRNIAAKYSNAPSTGAALLQGALAGGSGACGQRIGAIAVGQRADFCVLNADTPALQGIPQQHQLDALVFSSQAWEAKETWVAGARVWHREQLGQANFRAAMQALWR